jgi:hypothetical protein
VGGEGGSGQGVEGGVERRGGLEELDLEMDMRSLLGSTWEDPEELERQVCEAQAAYDANKDFVLRRWMCVSVCLRVCVCVIPDTGRRIESLPGTP